MANGSATWLSDKILFGLGDVISSVPFVSDLLVILTTGVINVLSSSATVAVLGLV